MNTTKNPNSTPSTTIKSHVSANGDVFLYEELHPQDAQELTNGGEHEQVFRCWFEESPEDVWYVEALTDAEPLAL